MHGDAVTFSLTLFPLCIIGALILECVIFIPIIGRRGCACRCGSCLESQCCIWTSSSGENMILISKANISKEIEHDSNCAVCLEAFDSTDSEQNQIQLQCSHHFHLNCIVPWLMENNVCPLCKNEVPVAIMQNTEYPSFNTSSLHYGACD